LSFDSLGLVPCHLIEIVKKKKWDEEREGKLFDWVVKVE
jgi:hypothetical protein